MMQFTRTTLLSAACLILLAAALPGHLRAQYKALPDAPSMHLMAMAGQAAMPAPQQPATSGAQPSTAPTSPSGPSLTLAEAERIAIKNNPNISVARLLALAQSQVTREVRSQYLPLATGDLTSVDAHDNGRITAGELNSPRVFDKAAGGLTVSQLITDFGRTHNLIRSAESNAKAQLENARATELDITLTVDQAFYQVLTTQAVLKVAEQTVAQRQATVDQVGALTKAKLRSTLDLSFAAVQLSQAKLLLLDAQNQAQDAMASFNNVLGFETNQQYTLVDQTSSTPEPPPTDAEALLPTAFGQRPDLAALNDQYLAARQYSTAERDLWMPTISALATVGGAPVRSDQIQSSWYAAAGANVSIPVFNGFLFNAREHEAKLRANAAHEQVRNLRNVIARDLRLAVLNAQSAFQRIGVTQEMMNESNLALDLSQERYKFGLGTIVELTQAQLGQTQAEIAYYNARYAYQTARAVVRYQLGQ
jgi:outer membrane protein